MTTRHSFDVLASSTHTATRAWIALAPLVLLAACDSAAPLEDAGERADASSAHDAGDLDAGPSDAGRSDAGMQDAGGEDGYASLGLGYRHSCAITSEGVARCWGSNFDGQLGRPETGVSLPAPGDVEGLGTAVMIAAGQNHSCAVLADGSVACWGDDTNGQLGRGATGGSSSAPVTVAGLSGATAGACGAFHSCALAGGVVRCWGANGFGQLGDGTMEDRSSPTEVTGIADAIALGVGEYHSCAVLAGGELRCWGMNGDGQLGAGSMTHRSEPVRVTGVGGVLEVVGGYGFTCARTSGGVSCWGTSSVGQLGDGTSGVRPTPGPVPVTGALGIAAGSVHACARLADGTARCWGYNADGQLGDGSDISGLPVIRRIPVAVMALTGVRTIAAGSSHTCAIVEGGAAFCWGDDDAGQLGDEGSGSQSVPVEVQP